MGILLPSSHCQFFLTLSTLPISLACITKYSLFHLFSYLLFFYTVYAIVLVFIDKKSMLLNLISETVVNGEHK